MYAPLLSTVLMLCAALLPFTGPLAPAQAEPVETSVQEAGVTAGAVDSVTVYRGQALVTRAVPLADAQPVLGGDDRLRELVVTDLPAQLLPGSLHAEAGPGVEVRSVRYRERAVRHDVRQEVRELDDQLKALDVKLEANLRRQQLVNQHENYLRKLENFVAPTAEQELRHGVLDANTLQTLTTFLRSEWQQAGERDLQLKDEARQLQQQRELLQRQRNELTRTSERTAREAVLLLSVSDKSPSPLRLSYLVGQANWSPSYNVRADAGGSDLLVEYNAQVEQLSGEDWSNVRMTLSTATPGLAAQAPLLEPMSVTLSAAVQRQGGLDSKAYQQQRRQLQVQMDNLDSWRASAGNGVFIADDESLNDAFMQSISSVQAGGQAVQMGDAYLNSNALEAQMLDLAVEGKIVNPPAELASSVEGVSVTYQLPGRVSLPSRRDQQLVRIAPLTFAADYYRVATPVLTSYVYREAQAINRSGQVLLGGPVTTYLDGEFVGQSQLPTVAVGEPFRVGLGIDAAFRAERELAEREQTVQGGNQVVTLTYRLTVRNFGTEPAEVRLLDRLPQARDGQLAVTPRFAEDKLSQDLRYRADDWPKGILRWDETIAPTQAGDGGFSKEYTFTLEYDRQMSLAVAK